MLIYFPYVRDTFKEKNIFRIIYIFLFFILLILLSPLKIYAEEQIRSTSLHILRTNEENGEREDYVNDNGVITDAADKHYATKIITKNANTVLEEFFHADGSPAVQSAGHYAILREFNEKGQNYKLTYLDMEGKPMMNTSGYASIIRSFNENGDIETEMYFDTENNPVETAYNAFGCFKEYDTQGNNIRTTFLNCYHEPCLSGQGFAIMRRNFYDSGDLTGKVKEEFYFDQNDNPIPLRLGQYGIYKEYDELGRNNLTTYLDNNGFPIVTTEGYSTIKKTFFADDSTESIRYYDIYGKPTSLSEGQYGYRVEKGEIIYLDSDGNDLFTIKNYLYNHQSSVFIACMLMVLVSLFCNRRINCFLLIAYVLSIVYMTLMGRNSGITIYKLDLFWSYRQFFLDSQLRREIINNILLFMPLGTILYRIVPKRRVILFAIFLSIIIESIQLVTATGWFELDDILSNGIGTSFGVLIGFLFLKFSSIV